MTFTIHNRGQNPEIFTTVDHAAFDRSWPEFLQHDPTGGLYYRHLEHVADYVLLATDGDLPVAKGRSLPFAFGIPGRQEPPDAGRGAVTRWAHSDRAHGRGTPTAPARA